MGNTSASATMSPTLQEFKISRTEWIWFMITGILLCLLGVMVLSSPFVFGVGATIAMGVLLIIGSVVQIYHAVKERSKPGFWFSLITGLLMGIIGVLVIMHPMISMLMLTLILISYLVIQGFFKAIYAFQLRPLQGWGWVLFSGIISSILGIFLLFQFPVSALYVLGIFLGIDLIMLGISEIAVAITWRRQERLGVTGAEAVAT